MFANVLWLTSDIDSGFNCVWGFQDPLTRRQSGHVEDAMGMTGLHKKRSFPVIDSTAVAS